MALAESRLPKETEEMNALARRIPGALLCAASMTPAFGQTQPHPEVPYQGRLRHSGMPVNGTADFQLRLFDAPSGGMQIGPTQDSSGVSVVDALFTVPLDFGAGAFNGDARYLEIAVRSPAGAGNFVILTPRQPVFAAPYAQKMPGRDGCSLGAADGSPADALIVNSIGEVGIGTPAPAGRLDISSGNLSYVRVDRANGDLHMNGGWDQVAGIYNDSTGMDARTDLVVNNWPQMVINGGGGVGIGTLNPLRRFTVVDGGIFTARFESSHPFYSYTEFANTTSGATWDLIVAGSPGAPGASRLTFQRGDSGFPAMDILPNSWVGLSESTPEYRLEVLNFGGPDGRARANAWTTYSSIRWKDNVRTLGGALDTLGHLRGVSFDWKPEYGGAHDIGFVAEEVGKVLPELVSWEPDGRWARGLAYDHVSAVTVEAVKEQQNRLDRQRRQIDSLERANAELREQVVSLGRVLAAGEEPAPR
jgi:Chaperone of endosialidase